MMFDGLLVSSAWIAVMFGQLRAEWRLRQRVVACGVGGFLEASK